MAQPNKLPVSRLIKTALVYDTRLRCNKLLMVNVKSTAMEPIIEFKMAGLLTAFLLCNNDALL